MRFNVGSYGESFDGDQMGRTRYFERQAITSNLPVGTRTLASRLNSNIWFFRRRDHLDAHWPSSARM